MHTEFSRPLVAPLRAPVVAFWIPFSHRFFFPPFSLSLRTLAANYRANAYSLSVVSRTNEQGALPKNGLPTAPSW